MSGLQIDWRQSALTISLLFASMFIIKWLIKHKYFLKRDSTKTLIIFLDFLGTVLIVKSIAASAGVSFGGIAAVGEAFSPMYGLYLVYLAFVLKIELHNNTI